MKEKKQFTSSGRISKLHFITSKTIIITIKVGVYKKVLIYRGILIVWLERSSLSQLRILKNTFVTAYNSKRYFWYTKLL